MKITYSFYLYYSYLLCACLYHLLPSELCLKLFSNRHNLAVGNPAAFHYILLALPLMFYNKNGVFQTHPDILGGGIST